ncbi:MAG TPA: AAA family ATPase, partial [Gemmataceae bacterium]|nr:AAA family ATPase [Gemmataceae bacterium]
MSDASHPDTPSPLPPAPALSTVCLPPEVWGADLAAAAAAKTSWLWDGYLAHGNVTLLTSQWKSGKTTLLSILLARRETGGEVAGLALAPGRTAVVSEESALLWNERRQKLGFGPSVAFQCRPFRGKPTTEQWLALIDRLADLNVRRGVDLAVIDTLASFLPGRDESNAGLMLEALLPLQHLTERGMAVLLLHHPRKGAPADAQAARGTGALAGYADIVLEMRHYTRAAEDDRRRVLHGYSRHEQTPRVRVIELNPEGTDYRCLGALADLEFEETWEQLRRLFEAAHSKRTRAEVLAAWPVDAVAPNEGTLWRWLDQAVARGLLRCEGAGRKTAPFRYWLPGQEEKWK